MTPSAYLALGLLALILITNEILRRREQMFRKRSTYERGAEGQLEFRTRPLPGGAPVEHEGRARYLGDWKDAKRQRMHCFETADDPPPQRIYLYPEEVVRFDHA